MQGCQVAGLGSHSQVCLTWTLVPDHDAELRPMVIPSSRWKPIVIIVTVEGGAPGWQVWVTVSPGPDSGASCPSRPWDHAEDARPASRGVHPWACVRGVGTLASISPGLGPVLQPVSFWVPLAIRPVDIRER